MTQDEYNKIDQVRAMCHGFAAAIQLHLQGHGDLNIPEMGRRLQQSNATLASILHTHPELYQRKTLQNDRKNYENHYQEPTFNWEGQS